MKRMQRTPLAVLVCASMLAFATSARSAAEVPLRGDAATSAAVWETFERWLSAYEKGDLNGIMEIFDANVVFSFQGIDDQSQPDLRKGYESDLRSRSVGSRWVPRVEEVYAEEKLAFVRAVWELQVQTAGKIDVKARNRSLDVFRYGDGHWRIIRSINYPEKR